jgi:apolipoprotein D and lipocalin family protein
MVNFGIQYSIMKKKILALGSAALFTATLFALNSCSSIPKGAKAIQGFEKEKYLGHWFEIARLDFVFEKNLNNTSADYSLNDDGSIKVVNKGYNYIKNKSVASTGKAKLVGDATEGRLKVSFFGPFYSGYNILALDSEYKYALVVGENLKLMWLLSREKTMPETIKTDYLKIAKDLGYDTSALIWVKHD